jgi:hypothetical protein
MASCRGLNSCRPARRVLCAAPPLEQAPDRAAFPAAIRAPEARRERRQPRDRPQRQDRPHRLDQRPSNCNYGNGPARKEIFRPGRVPARRGLDNAIRGARLALGKCAVRSRTVSSCSPSSWSERAGARQFKKGRRAPANRCSAWSASPHRRQCSRPQQNVCGLPSVPRILSTLPYQAS